MKKEIFKSDNNLKLYPKYRQLSMDFLFFYTINVLFLTQIKNIEMSSVVLVDTFYALFVVLLQIPATLIIGKIGKKWGTILGNVCNAIYLILVINSVNLVSLIFAELACAMGFALKDISEPAILNESINAEKEEKSKIFAKIQSKAVSGHYLLTAISMVLSGFLYTINGYIPMVLSLVIVLITLVMSLGFNEPKEEKEEEKVEEVSLKEAIKFCYKSTRCRCLLLFSAVFYGVITVLATYEISLLEDLETPAQFIGILFAGLNIISAIASKKQALFQKRFRNKALKILGFLISAVCIISGFTALLDLNIFVVFGILIFMYIIKYILVGLYNVLLIKYLSNFTNKTIDAKIYGINSFLSCVVSVLFGFIAAYLVDLFPTSGAMLIFGWGVLVIMSIVLFYMRDKVGLDPKEYSEIELKYETKV